MAQLDYTYADQGVALARIQQQVPGSGSVAPAVPIRLQTITWDEAYKDDLDYFMAGEGYTYLYQGTPPVALAIAQIQASALSADASSIAVASSWVDVRSVVVTTRGGSTVGLQVTALASMTLGTAEARVIVNGGAFPADTICGAASYGIPLGFNSPRTIATSAGDEAYTVKLQMRSVGVGSSIVPLAGTVLTAVEYRGPA